MTTGGGGGGEAGEREGAWEGRREGGRGRRGPQSGPPFRDPHETDIDPRLARVFDDWHRGVQGVPPAPEGHRDLGPAGRGDAQHPGGGTPAQPARVSRSSPLVCLRDVIHLRPLERKL